MHVGHIRLSWKRTRNMHSNTAILNALNYESSDTKYAAADKHSYKVAG